MSGAATEGPLRGPEPADAWGSGAPTANAGGGGGRGAARGSDVRGDGRHGDVAVQLAGRVREVLAGVEYPIAQARRNDGGAERGGPLQSSHVVVFFDPALGAPVLRLRQDVLGVWSHA